MQGGNAYRNISFEREAYGNDINPGYLSTPQSGPCGDMRDFSLCFHKGIRGLLRIRITWRLVRNKGSARRFLLMRNIRLALSLVLTVSASVFAFGDNVKISGKVVDK